MDRTLVALDLETTGLSPRVDRVIEVGAVRFVGDRVLERFHSLVSPQVPIPEAVQQLTGISDADVRDAPSPEGVLQRLVEFVGESPVVAHSGTFDLSFLYGTGTVRTLYDTLELARMLLPSAPSHSLPQLTRQLGLDHVRPHRALSDAEAAQQLFLHLFELARELPDELHDRMLEVSEQWPGPIHTFLMTARPSKGTISSESPQPPGVAVEKSRDGAPAERPEQIKDWLGPQGPIASRLADFEVREEQQQMALAIAQLLERGGRLLVEAGPGTGKSLAYLVPTVHHAVRKHERVVVATNTITLQEQLFHKDIPFLKAALPFDFKASLLKGRSNYVSLRRWNGYLNQPVRPSEPSAEEEVKFKLRMLVWLAKTGTGDRSEIKLSGTEEFFWQRAASTADDCLAARCPNYKTQRCFYWNSRRAAQEADLVITNHSLLLADALGNGTVLPPFKHLIVDEAHQLEETALETMVQRVGASELSDSLLALFGWSGRAVGELPEPVRSTVPSAQAAITRLFQSLGALIRELVPESTGYGQREQLILTPALREDTRVQSLAVEAAATLEAVGFARARIAQQVQEKIELGKLDPGSHAAHEVELFEEQLNQRLELLRRGLCKPGPEHLYWLALERRSGRPLLQSASLGAADLLRRRALDNKETAVFTSATLSVAGSFDYFKRAIGLSDAHEMILPAPFDYLSQALLCLPTDLLPLESPAFNDQTANLIAATASAIGGRTLVLFTSHQQLQEVAGLLETRLDPGLRVLAQNLHGTRRQLLLQFEENPAAVLLGTSSFWEGIDLPGDTLSCVIIVRLPFKVPTDPIQVARAAAVQDSFAEISLPEAVLRLKQGFGRLIRKRSDRGAAIVLDHRIANRAYGRAFIEGLPKAAAFLGLAEEVPVAVKQWLDR